MDVLPTPPLPEKKTYSGFMSVQCSLHLVVRRIVPGLDDLAVDSGHRKDLLAVACHELVDVGIVTELEWSLVDGIPFDHETRFLALQTFKVLGQVNKAFIDRRSTQSSRTTHSW